MKTIRKNNKRLWILIALAALLIGGFAAGGWLLDDTAVFAQLGDNDGDEAAEDEAEGPDVAITGDALEKASAAALEYMGEGRVTDSEVGDEEGYYEIELKLDDGTEVDVHLDENFNVLGHE